MILASASGNANSVKLILDYGGYDVNMVDKELKRTALMCAAKKGYSDIVEQLLQVPDIDINKKDISGMTALHFACRRGDTRSVELLLQMPGIDVNAKAGVSNYIFIMFY